MEVLLEIRVKDFSRASSGSSFPHDFNPLSRAICVEAMSQFAPTCDDGSARSEGSDMTVQRSVTWPKSKELSAHFRII